MRRTLLFFLLLTITALQAQEIDADESNAKELTGIASWYGGKFQGRKTANGEIFDTNKLTAAHKTLDFGTIVRVRNLENGEEVEVRINDRGPFVEGRVIDLSRAAAEEISMVATGVAPVELEIVSPPPGGVPQDLYKRHEKEQKAAGAATTTPATAARAAVGHIQVASFSSRENAERSRKTLEANGISSTLERSSNGHYRVIVPNVAQNRMDEMKERLARLGYPQVLIRSFLSSDS
jgi:rare lipoprotein A